MKFNKGDLVKVLKSSNESIPRIQKMLGKVCEIKEVLNENAYSVFEEGKQGAWVFMVDELEATTPIDEAEETITELV